MNNEKKQPETKNSGDAKGKASFDQNGKGASPKFGKAGDTSKQSGNGIHQKDKKGI